jgi:excisionase family DNA binding protein
VTEPWVSVSDVAKHLGVRKDSVYRWIEQRELPARKIGKLWKLKLSEVDAWVRGGGAEERLPTARARVLVIDDEALVRDTVAEFLADEGFVVQVAADGGEALTLLARAAPRPDLILLDLKMPHVDGWAFREQQVRDPVLAAIPIIVVTALGESAMPGVTTLRKPLRLPELARAVGDVLGLHAEVRP